MARGQHTDRQTESIPLCNREAQRASFCILKRARQMNLSVSCIIHIINTVVKPILLYGCEIFCFENISDLEAFYIQLLKRILSVKKSTPSFMVYAETVCEPLWVDSVILSQIL